MKRRDGSARRGSAGGFLTWLVVALAAAFPGHPLAEESDQGGLLGLLPQAAELQGWRPDGSPHQVVGQGLFSLINGGAEIFLKAGFSRAMTQPDGRADQQALQIEIYEMTSPEAARAVFTRKTQGDGQPVTVGTQGMMGAYYVIFWQDRFLVTVTGPDGTPDTQAALMVFSRAVETRIKQRR